VFRKKCLGISLPVNEGKWLKRIENSGRSIAVAETLIKHPTRTDVLEMGLTNVEKPHE
jgi:hypothetical protein